MCTANGTHSEVRELAAQLYRDSYPNLLGVAKYNACNEADAEEAVNDAFATFIQAFDSAGEAPALPWITLVLKRECWRRRRAAHLDRQLGRQAERGGEGPGSMIESIPSGAPELGLRIVERTALGYFTAGFSYRQIGQRHGWNRRKAETELENVMADVRRGIWQPPAPPARAPDHEPTFHEFSNDWFAAREPDWRPTTVADYRWSLELHLLPFFKDYLLSEINAEAIDRYATYKRTQGKPSNNSINKTLSRLSQILELAVDYEKIPRNPASSKKRRLSGERRSRSWVEPEQLMVLLDSCGSRGYRPLAATTAGAGLRVGEAVALSWRDVNLATGSLRIADAKTEAGVRTVDLPVGLAAELRALQARSTQTAPSDAVFRSRDGARQTSRNAPARLKPAIEIANVSLADLGKEALSADVSPHSLRRTYTSVRFALGDDPVYVAAQLGHARGLSFPERSLSLSVVGFEVETAFCVFLVIGHSLRSEA